MLKHIKEILCRVSPLILSCFTLVLTLNANSTNCFVMHQPKTPAKLDAFKKIK
ncbi:MAG: cyclic lactone autoinducer peptide [Acutalibacteraceae bacterium]|nr:cyclic lactone autoinducer peptide [Acutalibacteraceae bacterium]